MKAAANRRNSVPQTTTMSSIATNATRANGDLFIIMCRQGRVRDSQEKQMVTRGKSCWTKGSKRRAKLIAITQARLKQVA